MIPTDKKMKWEMCGAKRKAKRQQIRAFLLFGGKTETSIATNLKISLPAVCRVIAGKGHSSRVLEALRDAGVPEDILFDPRKEAHNE